MRCYAPTCTVLSRVMRCFSAVTGVLLCIALVQTWANDHDLQPSGFTLVSSDSTALLRISCMDGNSLFISLAVPTGNINPDALTISGAADIRWITGRQTERSVNSVYAAASRALLRVMVADAGKMTFTAGGPDFDTRALTGRQHNLPPA